MTKLSKNVSKFVLEFLEQHKSEDLNELWNSKSTQTSLKKMFNKENKKKDPLKPKRVKSSYLIFCDSERKVIKNENPTLSTKDITCELGRRWKIIKTDKKKYKKYEELAKKDKERYMNEMKKYKPSEGFEIKKGSNKDPNTPKRCKSAYLFFCNSVRNDIKQNNPELSNKDITKEMGRLWKNVKTDKKEYKKYEELANKDRERYNREKKEYMKGDKERVVEERVVEERVVEEVKLSAYHLYCRDYRESFKKNNPEMNPKQITRELASSWKGLDKKTKKKYKKLAK
jgi:hypothetical protein